MIKIFSVWTLENVGHPIEEACENLPVNNPRKVIGLGFNVGDMERPRTATEPAYRSETTRPQSPTVNVFLTTSHRKRLPMFKFSQKDPCHERRSNLEKKSI